MKDKRILLYRNGGIGDVMHTLPLVKYLRKKYPTSSIEYLTSSSIGDLLESHCSYIDKVWRVNKKNKRQSCLEIVKDSSRIDYFFNLHNSLNFYFINLFIFKARKYFQYKKDKSIHAVINFARTYDPLISAFELDVKTLSEKEAGELLKRYSLKENKYICIVPGVGKIRIHRRWPFENWLSMAKKFLYLNPDMKVVFMGGEDEMKMFENSLNALGERSVDLMGKLNLVDTAKIISKSSKIISCDTGLLHIASALSKSVIGLYGPTLPERTGPFASDYKIMSAKDCKCHGGLFEQKKCKLTRLPEGFCMDSLTVDNVLGNISGELAGKQIESVT